MPEGLPTEVLRAPWRRDLLLARRLSTVYVSPMSPSASGKGTPQQKAWLPTLSATFSHPVGGWAGGLWAACLADPGGSRQGCQRAVSE